MTEEDYETFADHFLRNPRPASALQFVRSWNGDLVRYDEAAHADLRKEWINEGTPWFSTRMPQPPGWNPADQMNRLLLTGTEMPNVPRFSISPRQTASYSFRSSRRKKRFTRAPSSHPSDLWSGLLAHSIA